MSELYISDRNISVAWAKAFLALMEPGKEERHPAVITISDLDTSPAIEDLRIRMRLDQELKQRKENSIATIANTIFPMSMWNPRLPNDAQALYQRYERVWPGIRKCPANRNGVYFRRLMAYQPNGVKEEERVNQLRFITDTYNKGNHRKSALQASIFDPSRDHTNNRQKGFPCLQQVAFMPIANGELSVTGFYATQYQFEKAYGNYLGLYALGQFMAKQLNLRLVQVVCIAAFLKRGNQTKGSLEPLANDIRSLLH